MLPSHPSDHQTTQGNDRTATADNHRQKHTSDGTEQAHTLYDDYTKAPSEKLLMNSETAQKDSAHLDSPPYFNASRRISRFLSMTERQAAPPETSSEVVDCMESSASIFWSFLCVFRTIACAIFWSDFSMVSTLERPSSSTLLDNRITICYLVGRR